MTTLSTTPCHRRQRPRHAGYVWGRFVYHARVRKIFIFGFCSAPNPKTKEAKTFERFAHRSKSAKIIQIRQPRKSQLFETKSRNAKPDDRAVVAGKRRVLFNRVIIVARIARSRVRFLNFAPIIENYELDSPQVVQIEKVALAGMATSGAASNGGRG